MNIGDWTLLLTAALAAGWVDSVVGGGGLILIPVLLLVAPSLSLPNALATNKLAAVFGTTAAVVTFARRIPMKWSLLAPAAVAAACASAVGARAVSSIDKDSFIPIVLVVLVVVALLVVLRPNIGTVTGAPDPTARRLTVVVLTAAVAIGFYDGLLGPGTGTFLIIVFATALGTEFVRSAAMAKVLNVGSNLGALIYFAANGDVLWRLGLAMAVANVVGAVLGSRTAMSRGAGFVRIVLLVVVIALVVRLSFQQFG